VILRAAIRDDAEAIWHLLAESAAEQGEPESLVVTIEDILVDGFGPEPRFHALLAELDGEAVGLALYFFNYSTWVSRDGLYLEDLYVRPEHRRKGIAESMMIELARIAHKRGCKRLQWVVLKDNPAVQFYERMGARTLEEWALMSLKHEVLQRLAESD
jgi:GNAT superfamily N-acetyltransferase